MIYKGAANRSYYAVFHAIRSVMAIDGTDMKHHSGVIAEFRRRYIKTGEFRKELSDIISAVFDIRTGSDYNDFYVVSKKEVTEQIENARVFVSEITDYLETHGFIKPKTGEE